MKISVVVVISDNYSFLILKNNLKPGYKRWENVSGVDFVHVSITVIIDTMIWLTNEKTGEYFCKRNGNVNV